MAKLKRGISRGWTGWAGGPHLTLPKKLGAPGLDFETWETANLNPRALLSTDHCPLTTDRHLQIIRSEARTIIVGEKNAGP
jgi:hypothetical protein